MVANLSVVELIQRCPSESLQHAKESLELAEQIKEPHYIACVYGNIGLALEHEGRWVKRSFVHLGCAKISDAARGASLIYHDKGANLTSLSHAMRPGLKIRHFWVEKSLFLLIILY